MRRNRFGCLTSTGILAVLITFLAIGGVVYAKGGLLFNPGPLNAQAGEQQLGGVSSHSEIAAGQCDACHAAPWEWTSMADRCVVCHNDVASQLQNPSSLHGMVVQTNSNPACQDCHPEHRGSDAPLTLADLTNFPHESLGFSLDGHNLTVQNEPFTCSDCHGANISTFNPTACVTCHQEEEAVFTQAHILSFGIACLDCHDGIDSLGKNFDHNRLSFQLVGKHTNVFCAKCHLDARNLADFQSAPKDCVSCHQTDDSHAGSFGLDCAACHSPDGWQPAKFDHNLANFKLEGKHTNVPCEDCHQEGVYQSTPSTCYACHQKDDKHQTHFGIDCAGCHDPSGWSNATFDHSRSGFPLTGAHNSVQCEVCHQASQFTGLSTACVACHADPGFHTGAFGTNCATCHNTSSWGQARFDFSHPQPRVEEGGNGISHGGTTCRTCHPSSVYSYTCLACHSNNQGGEGGHDD